MSQPLNEEYLVSLIKKGLVEFMKERLEDCAYGAVRGDVAVFKGYLEPYLQAEAMLRDEKALLKFAREVMSK